jgi:hypothetical protein
MIDNFFSGVGEISTASGVENISLAANTDNNGCLFSA